MKKFILIALMAMLFGVTNKADAQTLYFRTYQFAIKYKTNYGNWTDWSDWQKSDMKMKIDMDDDMIIIYSQRVQVYRVISHEGSYVDDSGGKQTKFYVIDQDDDYGYVRLRVEKNGNSQIYVDFNDVMWVYNVRRINSE